MSGEHPYRDITQADPSIMSRSDWFDTCSQLIIGTASLLYVITPLPCHALYYKARMTHAPVPADSRWRRMWRHPYLWLDSWLIVYHMWLSLRYMWCVCYLWLDFVLVIPRYIGCTVETRDSPSRSSWLVRYRSHPLLLLSSPSVTYLRPRFSSAGLIRLALRIPSWLC